MNIDKTDTDIEIVPDSNGALHTPAGPNGPLAGAVLFAQQEEIPRETAVIGAFSALAMRYRFEEEGPALLCIRPLADGAPSMEIRPELSRRMSGLEICREIARQMAASLPPHERSRLAPPFSCTLLSEETGLAEMALTCMTDAEQRVLSIDTPAGSPLMHIASKNDHFDRLLREMTARPLAPAGSLPLLSEPEWARIRALSVEHISPAISAPSCLHDLFDHTARMHGGRAALRCDGRELTYARLSARAEAIAGACALTGAGRGRLVGIVLPRSLDVFAAILGVLKTGAAYVPLDPRWPAERIAGILDDADASLVLTTAALREKFGFGRPCLTIEETGDAGPPRQGASDRACGPDDPAYVIYTSGTTGRPKGVVVSHKAACNLVRAEQHLFGVNAHDRVFQGFSLAFDASLEEMWLAWSAGALLVAGTDAEVLSGPDLQSVLRQEQITVFSTVPTQIALMTEPVKSVRILILGGERCPLRAIGPWLDNKRKVYNTYGPTEATVIATCGLCDDKSAAPSLGRPIPNAAVFVLDSAHNPLPLGATGELCVGGCGLAAGYLNAEELTARRFIVPPFPLDDGFARRLYCSGDLVRMNADGTIDFSGRKDTQVKLRGHRIELGEIESALLSNADILSAAAAVHENGQGIAMLMGYVVPRSGASVDEAALREGLKARLPQYMVPAAIRVLERMPALHSGKIDRKRLPGPRAPVDGPKAPKAGPATPTEALVIEAWSKFFENTAFSAQDDFFEIGGHSLLAALIVSELRKHPGMERLPLQAIYKNPTVERLSAFIDASRPKRTRSPLPFRDFLKAAPDKKAASARGLRRLACGLGQVAALYPLYFLFCSSLLMFFTVYRLFPGKGFAIAVAITGAFVMFPFMTAVSIIAKWTIIGRFKAGSYPLWGWYYWRFWFVSRVMDLASTRILRGTPFMVWYGRLMGAKIGANVYLGTDRFRAWDMISIGDGAHIDADAYMAAYTVADGRLHIGPISIGHGASVGSRSMLCENTVIEPEGRLAPQSMAPSGSRLRAGPYWEGSPAEPAEPPAHLDENHYCAKISRGGRSRHLVFAAAFIAVQAFPFVLLLGWTIAAVEIYLRYGVGAALASSVPLSALYVITFCGAVTLAKFLIAPRLAAGNCPLNSIAYIRKWTADTLVQMSLTMVQPLYATLFLPFWLRSLGARIGRRSEISTLDHMTADLLDIGEGSFIADSVSLGAPRTAHGSMTVDRVSIGRRTFLGNSALITPGTKLGDNCLVGVLSVPPRKCLERPVHDESWLGSPPITLPRREPSASFDITRTFEPTRGLMMLRSLIEFFKVTLPPALMSVCFIFSYWLFVELFGAGARLWRLLLLYPVVMAFSAFCVALVPVAAKWMIMRRYCPRQAPLWSPFVWGNEFINALCENVSFPLVFRLIVATPMLPWFFRLLGCKIGKNVFMETTEITEFDLVSVGDGASLNFHCTIQTHLFEDRVMKMDALRIGDGAVIGPLATVLYGSEMKEGSRLAGLSLLMKGETLPAGTSWQGIPAEAAAEPKGGVGG